MIMITIITASDIIKNQLKSMYIKDMIQKCQSIIAERFKKKHVFKIHDINKLSNDEYRFHCKLKKDFQLLNKMN